MEHQYAVEFECLFTGKRHTETISAPSADLDTRTGLTPEPLFDKEGHYVRSIQYVGVDTRLRQCANDAIERGGIPV